MKTNDPIVTVDFDKKYIVISKPVTRNGNPAERFTKETALRIADQINDDYARRAATPGSNLNDDYVATDSVKFTLAEYISEGRNGYPEASFVLSYKGTQNLADDEHYAAAPCLVEAIERVDTAYGVIYMDDTYGLEVNSETLIRNKSDDWSYCMGQCTIHRHRLFHLFSGRQAASGKY